MKSASISTPSAERVPSALQSALGILLRNNFSAEDLPLDVNNPQWLRLEKEFQLSFGQTCALQNFAQKRDKNCNLTISPASALPINEQPVVVKNATKRKRKVTVTNSKEEAIGLVEESSSSDRGS